MSAAGGGKPEVGGDVRGPNSDPSTIAVVGSKDDGAVKGGLARMEVSAVHEDQSDGGADRAAQGVMTSSMGDFVAFALIFLRSEIEADRGRDLNLREGSNGKIELPGPEGQVNIAEGEGRVIGCGTGVFARSEEKIERQTNNISVGLDSSGGDGIGMSIIE